LLDKALRPAARTIEDYISQGYTPRKARALVKEYIGRGHHYFPLNRPIKILGHEIDIPNFVKESKFNVLKPKNMSVGDFHRLHYSVDPSFYGARLSGLWGKGSGYSGKFDKAVKLDQLGRLWHGMPDRLRHAADLAAASLGMTGYLIADKQRPHRRPIKDPSSAHARRPNRNVGAPIRGVRSTAYPLDGSPSISHSRPTQTSEKDDRSRTNESANYNVPTVRELIQLGAPPLFPLAVARIVPGALDWLGVSDRRRRGR